MLDCRSNFGNSAFVGLGLSVKGNWKGEWMLVHMLYII